ncbi:MAG TPA: FkbM family methyltransferase [Pyrinomonadaceae bacterium]|nr:FkbM family methyltransferase [Pyrinomonadaceae bacterium]
MLRTIAERISRGVTLKRKLPEEFGGLTLYVTPDSSLKYWQRDIGKVDPWLLGMAKELARPGSVVWDIGANVGLFAFACAGLGSSVLAVEPDEKLSALLRQSAVINHLPVVVHSVAVSDRAGTAAFHVAARGRASNHLGAAVSSQTGGTRETRTVETATLDSLLDSHPAPDVLKIDVEGAEAEVLRGASKVLALRPRILIEVAESRADEVTRILRAYRYELFDAGTHEPVGRAVWNTLALPGRS